jgi:L-alanine-DL-glutamate epimerase-like enolase superfamily enzyme
MPAPDAVLESLDATALPCRPTEIRLHLLSLPLRVPYSLAMGAVTQFDTILVEVTAGEGVRAPGWGEATILTGYTDETLQSAWDTAQYLASELVRIEPEAGGHLLSRRLRDAPFTVSAFRSALEFAADPHLLATDVPRRVPLLAGLNATDPAGITAEMEVALAAGFRTMKVKVGFDVEADLARCRLIQRLNAGRLSLRIDGNQGFTQQAGCRFAASLDPDAIELLEQPCPAGDWQAALAVARVAAVPVMLDESIYGPDDIRRAAELGCARFVKLKLMKMGGVAALESGLRLIRALGMEPVLGNGVATEIGCWAEAAIASRLVRNAGEMNGFLRPAATLLRTPLRREDGAVVLPPGPMAAPDPAQLAAHQVAHAHHR